MLEDRLLGLLICVVPPPALTSPDPVSAGKHLRAPPLPSAPHSQPPWLPQDLSTGQLPLPPSLSGLGPGSSQRKLKDLLPGCTASWVPAPSREGSPGSLLEPPVELSLYRLPA